PSCRCRPHLPGAAACPDAVTETGSSAARDRSRRDAPAAHPVNGRGSARGNAHLSSMTSLLARPAIGTYARRRAYALRPYRRALSILYRVGWATTGCGELP